MNSITILTPEALRKAADIQERIQSLQSELGSLLSGLASEPEGTSRQSNRDGVKKRRLSARGLANIRAGVARRWGAQKGNVTPVAAKGTKKRRMSAAGRAAIAAAARRRWAKAKAAGRNRL